MLFNSVYGGYMKSLVKLINMLNEQFDLYNNWEVEIEINKAITALLKEYCKQKLGLTREYEIVIADLNRNKKYGKTHGCYVDETKKVMLDRTSTGYVEYAIEHKINYLFSIVETLLHEFRHAWQYEGNMEIPKEYIRSENEETHEKYLNQPIEVDARNWASINSKYACEYVAANLVQYLLK